MTPQLTKDHPMQRLSIEHVAPLVIVTPVDGVEVTIKPITVGQYPALFEQIAPLLQSTTQAPAGLFERLAARQADGEDVQWLVGMVLAHSDEVMAAIALAIGQPREWVSALLPDRFLELAILVLEVNADFFMRARPVLRLLWARAQAALPKEPAAAAPATAPANGPTPSSA
jgi:hypothetical protein